MNWKNSFLGLIMATSAAVSMQAQDVHFTQFNMSPLTINPSYTGLHNGMWRANAIYRNQWANVTTPFVTVGASADAPIYRNKNTDNYLAAGINLFSDKSGDGALLNNTAMASLAYHLFMGSNNYDGSRFNPSSSLSFGMQGGYAQKSIDLSALYFSDQFRNGGYNPGTSQQILENRTGNFIVNAGANFGTRLSKGFGLQLGAAAYNINQPLESFTVSDKSKSVGLGMRINTQLGMDIRLGERMNLRPAFLYQSQANATEMIAGTEVSYAMGISPEVRSQSSKVFLGYYNRLGDAHLINAGFETNGFRFGAAYDMTSSLLKNAGANVGSFEIGVTYTKPNPLDAARRIFLPCSRF